MATNDTKMGWNCDSNKSANIIVKHTNSDIVSSSIRETTGFKSQTRDTRNPPPLPPRGPEFTHLTFPVCHAVAVADPDLQIRGRGGGGWPSPPCDTGGGGCLNFFFLPFEPQFGLKIRRGGTGPPGALPWIRHWVRPGRGCSSSFECEYLAQFPRPRGIKQKVWIVNPSETSLVWIL